jgi:hypothetical protein
LVTRRRQIIEMTVAERHRRRMTASAPVRAGIELTPWKTA